MLFLWRSGIQIYVEICKFLRTGELVFIINHIYADVRGAINYLYKTGAWGGSESDSAGRAVTGGEKDD